MHRITASRNIQFPILASKKTSGTQSASASLKALEANSPSTEPMQETSLQRTQIFLQVILVQMIAIHQVMHAMSCTSLEWELDAIATTLRESLMNSRLRLKRTAIGHLQAIGPSGKAKVEILTMPSTMEQCNVLVSSMVLIGYFRMDLLLLKQWS